jgi:hypothetical protein
VVFYYADNLYLFWFQNRVWQVRMDARYSGPVLGKISLGQSREEVVSELGLPFHSDDESIMYNLPPLGYPLRIRLFFEDSRLSDVYIYRGDF